MTKKSDNKAADKKATTKPAGAGKKANDHDSGSGGHGIGPATDDENTGEEINLEEKILKLETENAELKEAFNAALAKKYEDPVCVVIPYVKDFAQGNELRNALRGWDKNFKENFKVVVVGDKEDWFSDKVLHIPHKRIGDNPPMDIVSKMKAIIKSDLVPEKFVWSNDDIYPLNPIFLHDIMVLKCVGKLENATIPDNLYGRNKKATYELLVSLKKSTYDYSTHLPVVYEKSKLQLLIEKYKLDKNARLIQSLYFNFFFSGVTPHKLHVDKDIWKVGVYRKDPDLKKMHEYVKNRKFFNHSQTGFIKEVKKLLDEKFNKKSSFEK